MHKICTSVEKAVDNFVENPVDNYSIIHQSTDTNQIIVDFHRFIPSIYESFPLKKKKKRYKLINFAPKTRIVDKSCNLLRVYGLWFIDIVDK